MKYSIKDGVLHKYEKDGSKLRNFGKEGAWSVRFDLLPLGVHTIVYETKTAIYKTDVKTLKEKGFQMVMKGEPKWILSLKHWQVTKKGVDDARLF